MKFVRFTCAGLALVFMSACAPLMAPPYSADFAALDKLKRQANDKVAVGTVQPRDSAAPVNKISLRAASLVSASGSFAQYLEDALISDLREIAIYDAKADVRIDAVLVKNNIDIGGFSTGTGDIAVDVTVSRTGKNLLTKRYAATTSFESSFAGAVAIPKAQSEYGTLVRTLLSQVYADADFVNAIKK
jgi:hypothetical protein